MPHVKAPGKHSKRHQILIGMTTYLNVALSGMVNKAELLESELFATDLLRFHLDHLLSAEQVRPPRVAHSDRGFR